MVEILLVDNGTKYIKDLKNTLNGYNFTCIVYDKLVDTSLDVFDGFILSGGRGGTIQDITNYKIIEHCHTCNKTLLGICYGSELLALYRDCKLGRLYGLRHLHQDIVINFTLLDKHTINVFSSHRYFISELSPSVHILSRSSIPEMIHIKDTNMYGTQFHPEKTIDGQNIIHVLFNLFSRSKH